MNFLGALRLKKDTQISGSRLNTGLNIAEANTPTPKQTGDKYIPGSKPKQNGNHKGSKCAPVGFDRLLRPSVHPWGPVGDIWQHDTGCEAS